jgi:hypothetical protein
VNASERWLSRKGSVVYRVVEGGLAASMWVEISMELRLTCVEDNEEGWKR